MITEKQIRACHNHQTAMTIAADLLTTIGHFSFADVEGRVSKVRKLLPGSFVIHWKRVRKLLEKDYDTRLTPLSEDMFSSHTVGDELVNPKKYIAYGHGKFTAGYAAPVNGKYHLAERYLGQRLVTRNGVVAAFNGTLAIVNDNLKQDELPVWTEQHLLHKVKP